MQTHSGKRLEPDLADNIPVVKRRRPRKISYTIVEEFSKHEDEDFERMKERCMESLRQNAVS